MKILKCPANLDTFQALLDNCAKNKHLSRAMFVLKDMLYSKLKFKNQEKLTNFFSTLFK
jgi:pentatricopeptide repeat protein